MPKTILPLLLLLCAVQLGSQTTYHKILPGYHTKDLAPLDSGGMLVAASKYSVKTASMYRLSETGQIIWHKEYPELIEFQSIIKSEDNFLATGGLKVPGGYSPVLLKIAPNGTTIWSKTVNQPGTLNKLFNAPNGFIWSVDSGKFINGNYTALPTFIRVDNDGNPLWSKGYSGGIDFYRFEAIHIQGDTIFATGRIKDHGCFVRINLNTGEVIGTTTFGGPYTEAFYSIEPTSDGNFLLAGTTNTTTFSEESRPWLVKISPDGQIIWSKTYNLPVFSGTCFMTRAHGDDGFILSISTDNAGPKYASFISIDEDGNQRWGKNYSGGQLLWLTKISKTPDGGYAAVGGKSYSSNVLKTDVLGNVANGCCPEPVSFMVEDFAPTLYNYVLTAEDWNIPEPINLVSEPIFDSSTDVCQLPITSLNIQVPLCKNDSFELNGVQYAAPNTIQDTVASTNGGCDTIKIYTLSLLPEPYQYHSIKFCPGTSVNIDGVEYTQPITFTKTKPASIGCDTLVAYALSFKTLPQRAEYINFCQGDTAWVNGSPFLSPNILTETIPGAGNTCDTIVTYYLNWLNYNASVVTMNCPGNILANVISPAPKIVDYPDISASSNCPCPNISYTLEQGLPSGSLFPLGSTTVCYKAKDACNNTSTCCFQVRVEEENACDTKVIGCVKFELLGYAVDAAHRNSYRIRVTNNCASPLNYMAIGLPNAVIGYAPQEGAPYISPNGHSYEIRNASLSPFRSVCYKALASGIANGASDIFEYTLPPLSDPIFIRIGASLVPHNLYETTLNTFGCFTQAEDRDDLFVEKTATFEVPSVKVFPNPSIGKLFIDLSGWKEQVAEITVRNAQGALVALENDMGIDGVWVVGLPISAANGLYWLTVAAEGGRRASTKFTLVR